MADGAVGGVTRRFVCAGRGVRDGKGRTAASSELSLCLCRVGGEDCCGLCGVVGMVEGAG
jgi:hypothetical protein